MGKKKKKKSSRGLFSPASPCAGTLPFWAHCFFLLHVNCANEGRDACSTAFGMPALTEQSKSSIKQALHAVCSPRPFPPAKERGALQVTPMLQEPEWGWGDRQTFLSNFYAMLVKQSEVRLTMEQPMTGKSPQKWRISACSISMLPISNPPHSAANAERHYKMCLSCETHFICLFLWPVRNK